MRLVGIAKTVGSLILIYLTLFNIQSRACEKDKKNDPCSVHVRQPAPEYYPLAYVQNGKISSYLDELWQYGLLATSAYDDTFSGSLSQYCKGTSRKLDDWRIVHGFENLLEKPKFRIEMPGLGVRIWQDIRHKSQKKIAIVFRGTDRNEFGDLHANLRWITRFNPITRDQYQQTRKLVQVLVPELKKKFGNDVNIIAVGHSLGGGLAQHAGYGSPDISLVYAFASSPVTGSTSFDVQNIKTGKLGLKIFRIFESGEGLAKLRATQRNFRTLSAVDPAEKEVRFSFRRSTIQGGEKGIGLVSQHSVQTLSCDMICHLVEKRPNHVCRQRQ